MIIILRRWALRREIRELKARRKDMLAIIARCTPGVYRGYLKAKFKFELFIIEHELETNRDQLSKLP